MLSIIIINHNTKALCRDCIESIKKSTHSLDYEVVVVDNSDKKEELFACEEGFVKIIRCENNGFGHACNRGVEAAAGDYVLMLNSDTVVHDGALEKCVSYLEQNPDTGAVGAKLLLSDGTMDHGCRRGFPTPSASFYYMLGFDKRHPENKKYGAYRLAYLSEDETAEVDVVSGAFLMLKKSLYSELGGFDEAFFMYGEDIDLCYRIKEKGKKVVFYPEATVLHLKGQSGLHTKNRKIIYHFYNAMIIFYKKHYAKKYNIFVNLFIYLAIYAKLGLAMIKSFIGGKRNG